MVKSFKGNLDNIVYLEAEDINLIQEMESQTWIPGARASRERILERFDLGHTMLGSFERGKLSGLVAWSYAYFDPNNREIFPKTFEEFSTAKNNDSNYNSGFVYNLSIRPEFRSLKTSINLMRASILEQKRLGCSYAVGDTRCASYNGSHNEFEDIKHSPIFKQAIDRYVQEGIFPTEKELLENQMCRFHKRFLNCDFHWIMPNFIPSDEASGGFRIIMSTRLDQFDENGKLIREK